MPATPKAFFISLMPGNVLLPAPSGRSAMCSYLHHQAISLLCSHAMFTCYVLKLWSQTMVSSYSLMLCSHALLSCYVLIKSCDQLTAPDSNANTNLTLVAVRAMLCALVCTVEQSPLGYCRTNPHLWQSVGRGGARISIQSGLGLGSRFGYIVV